jgi:hypothetical protein
MKKHRVVAVVPIAHATTIGIMSGTAYLTSQAIPPSIYKGETSLRTKANRGRFRSKKRSAAQVALASSETSPPQSDARLGFPHNP